MGDTGVDKDAVATQPLDRYYSRGAEEDRAHIQFGQDMGGSRRLGTGDAQWVVAAAVVGVEGVVGMNVALQAVSAADFLEEH